jgi:hypothetical protein
VFVDETGANTKMVRVYGRCRRGERLVCKTPWGHWKTTTFTCGLRCDGLVAPWVLEGPMTGDAFLIYVEKVLVPTLSRDDTVIIDNLSSHKVAGVREAIEAVGAKLIYLPPYSPDLNPIELPSPSSRPGCERPQNEPSTTCGAELAFSSTTSRRRNAKTTSATMDMPQIK